jgi:NADH-quinone oxidoreductase subunit N
MLAYSSIAHACYMIFALLDVTGSRACSGMSPSMRWRRFSRARASTCCAQATTMNCSASTAVLPATRSPPWCWLSVLSLAGLPPLPGFFAKLFVFTSVIASGHLAAAILAFVGSFLGLAYYLASVVRPFRSDVASQATLAAERTRVEVTV